MRLLFVARQFAWLRQLVEADVCLRMWVWVSMVLIGVRAAVRSIGRLHLVVHAGFLQASG
jgi:hypothetical protein